MEPEVTPAALPAVEATEAEHQADVSLAAEISLLSLRMSLQTLLTDEGSASSEAMDQMHRDFIAFVQRHGDTLSEHAGLRGKFTDLVSYFRQMAKEAGYSLDKEV